MASPKFDERTVAVVLECRRAGMSRVSCAKAASISRDTLNEWLRASQRGDETYCGFASAFDRAAAEYREVRLAQIRSSLGIPAVSSSHTEPGCTA